MPNIRISLAVSGSDAYSVEVRSACKAALVLGSSAVVMIAYASLDSWQVTFFKTKNSVPVPVVRIKIYNSHIQDSDNKGHNVARS